MLIVVFLSSASSTGRGVLSLPWVIAGSVRLGRVLRLVRVNAAVLCADDDKLVRDRRAGDDRRANVGLPNTFAVVDADDRQTPAGRAEHGPLVGDDRRAANAGTTATAETAATATVAGS